MYNDDLVYAYIEMVVQQRIQRPGRGLRNMKSMRPPLAAISFITYFYRDRGHGPLGPPGSATVVKENLYGNFDFLLSHLK